MQVCELLAAANLRKPVPCGHESTGFRLQAIARLESETTVEKYGVMGMKRTVDEKYDYNMRRMRETKDMSEKSFSSGYCMGVAMYQGYGKNSGMADMQRRRKFIDNAKIKAQNGDLHCKGIMCGVRDAANERKARKGK